MKMKTLRETFPDWDNGGGIFVALQTLVVPWADPNIAQALDLVYFGNISGNKWVSPLVSTLTDDDEASAANILTLANTLLALEGDYWQRVYDTLDLEYNPISNYDMVEVMSDDDTVITFGKSVLRTDDFTHSKTGTETQAPNTTTTTTPGVTETKLDKTSGFNSSALVDSGSTVTSRTGYDTVAETGTDTLTYNTSDRDAGNQRNSESGTETHAHDYRLTRSGNIGVTTSQQMLQSERDLWIWNYFYDYVFPSVDKVLALRVY